MENGNELINIAESLGTVSVLAGIVYGFYKGWIVPKYVLDMTIEEKDKHIASLEEEIEDLKNG